MALQRLLHEPERCRLVAGLRDVALEDLALVIDGAPQIHHLAIELHEHLIKVPSPVAKAAHPRDSLALDFSREHRTEPVPPQPHRLMTNVDAALEQQVLDGR